MTHGGREGSEMVQKFNKYYLNGPKGLPCFTSMTEFEIMFVFKFSTEKRKFESLQSLFRVAVTL